MASSLVSLSLLVAALSVDSTVPECRATQQEGRETQKRDNGQRRGGVNEVDGRGEKWRKAAQSHTRDTVRKTVQEF